MRTADMPEGAVVVTGKLSTKVILTKVGPDRWRHTSGETQTDQQVQWWLNHRPETTTVSLPN